MTDPKRALTHSCPKSGFVGSVLDSIRRLDLGGTARKIAENPCLRAYSVASASLQLRSVCRGDLEQHPNELETSSQPPGDGSRVFSGLDPVDSPIGGYLGQQWR